MGIADIEEQDESKWKEYVKELKMKKYMIVEGWYRRKDATVFDIEINLKYLEHEKGNYIIAISRDITLRKQNEKILKENAENLKLYSLKLEERTEELDNSNRDLQKALDEIKTIKGIIPICSYCKSILNDEGAWDRMESYVSKHTEAHFSHGICPKCMAKSCWNDV